MSNRPQFLLKDCRLTLKVIIDKIFSLRVDQITPKKLGSQNTVPSAGLAALLASLVISRLYFSSPPPARPQKTKQRHATSQQQSHV